MQAFSMLSQEIVQTQMELNEEDDPVELYCVLVDYIEAYTSVKHSKLIEIVQVKLGKKWANYVAKWLKNQTAVVRIQDKDSDLIQIGRGLPQGDPISPLMYNFYSDDLLTTVRYTTTLGFADDILLWSYFRQYVLNRLKKLQDDSAPLELKIHKEKTQLKVISISYDKISFIGGKTLVLDEFTLKSNAQPLTYLGVSINSQGNEGNPFDKTWKPVNEKMKDRILNASVLTNENFLRLLEMATKSYAVYPAAMGALPSKKMMDKMDVTHCKKLRVAGFLDFRTSKKFLFSPMTIGGAGLEMMHVMIHTIFIWFSVLLLNSTSAVVRRKCRQNWTYLEQHGDEIAKSLMNMWMSLSELLTIYRLELKRSDDIYSIFASESILDKESLRKVIKEHSIHEMIKTTESFDVDATFHYDSVALRSFSYWKNSTLSAKQCKLFFFKLATGLWNTSFKMGSLNACILCKDHGVQDNKTTLEHVILKCPFLKEKVERVYATISNIIRIPFKLCWESEFQDSILCISPRGNFNIHEKILLRESIREIQSTLVEYLGPLKTLSDI